MPTSLTPTLRSSSSRGALPSTRRAVVAVGVLCVLGAGLRAEPPCATRLAIEPSPNPEDADVARLYAVTVLAPDDIWAVGLWRACTDCAPFENTQVTFPPETSPVIEWYSAARSAGSGRISDEQSDAALCGTDRQQAP